MSGLTASSSVQTDASKNLISVTNTGTGNNVMSASPTLTGTLNCAGISGTLNFATTGFLEGTRLNISRTETGGQTVGTFLQPNLTGTNRASIFIGKSTSLDQGFTISGGTSKLQINRNGYLDTLVVNTYGDASSSFSTGAVTVYGDVAIDGKIRNRSLDIAGSTSGVVSINPQAAAGTYNFNLPITSGSSGDLLTSAGGGATAMTWTGSTGTGNLVRATSATLVTPTLGVASATSLSSGPITLTGVSTASTTVFPVTSASTSATNIATFLASSASSTNMILGQTLSGSQHTYWASSTDNLTLGIGGGSNSIQLLANVFNVSVTRPSSGNIATFLAPTAAGDTYMLVGKSTGVDQSCVLGYSVPSNRGFLSITGRSESLSFYSNGNVDVRTRLKALGVLAAAQVTIDQQGAYMSWNDIGGTGATFFNNQRGLGGGGWYWRGYNSGNVQDTTAMVLSNVGELTIGALSANKAVFTNGSSTLVSRIAGSGALITASANTPIPNNTWTRITNLVYSSTAGNGTLSIISGNELRNNTGEQILVNMTYSGSKLVNALGFTRTRIVHSALGDLCYTDVSGIDYASLSCSIYLTNGQSLWVDAYQNSGSGGDIGNVRITVNTHPNV